MVAGLLPEIMLRGINQSVLFLVESGLQRADPVHHPEQGAYLPGAEGVATSEQYLVQVIYQIDLVPQQM